MSTHVWMSKKILYAQQISESWHAVLVQGALSSNQLELLQLTSGNLATVHNFLESWFHLMSQTCKISDGCCSYQYPNYQTLTSLADMWYLAADLGQTLWNLVQYVPSVTQGTNLTAEVLVTSRKSGSWAAIVSIRNKHGKQYSRRIWHMEQLANVWLISLRIKQCIIESISSWCSCNIHRTL